MDQMFALKNVPMKYLEKEKNLYVVLMNLVKLFKRINRDAL